MEVEADERGRGGGGGERYNDSSINPEVSLIKWSPVALHIQGGGPVMLHLSFLRDNPRLVAFGDGRRTGRKRMIHMVVCTRVVLMSDRGQ